MKGSEHQRSDVMDVTSGQLCDATTSLYHSLAGFWENPSVGATRRPVTSHAEKYTAKMADCQTVF
jgi:hypothetical protein